MDRTVDFWKHGDKTILVKNKRVQIDPEVEINYVRDEMMHPSVVKIWSLYANDLSQRLGLNETRLKPELTFSNLLNELYDLQSRRELLKQEYALQHSTLALSQVGLHVYMSALVLL